MCRSLVVVVVSLSWSSLAAGCPSSVVSGGQVVADQDPHTGEQRLGLVDLESDGVTLSGQAYVDHDGAVFWLSTVSDTVRWQACHEIELISGGDALKAAAGERELDSASDGFGGVWHAERLTFILYDRDLGWLVRAPALMIRACSKVARIDAEPLATLRDFAAAVVDAHAGKEGLPPIVVPSE